MSDISRRIDFAVGDLREFLQDTFGPRDDTLKVERVNGGQRKLVPPRLMTPLKSGT